MGQLEYRNYKQGDEFGLAKVHNHAFQALGGGFLRSAHLVKYRYCERPGFDPREICIAEDTDSGQIVGVIMCTQEKYTFNDTIYPFYAINDVATMPGWGGKGIAKNLMNLANEYVSSKGLEYGMLSADPHGFPRSKIYLKDGFYDYNMGNIYIHFTGIGHIVSHFPLFFPMSPALLLKKSLPNYFAEGYLKKIESCENPKISHTMTKGVPNEPFRLKMNEIMASTFNGYSPFTPELWDWAKIHPAIPSLEPSLISLYLGDKMIGGALLRSQWMYSVKFNFRINIGMITEFFIDEARVPKNLISYVYLKLLKLTLNESYTRGNGISFFTDSGKIPTMEWALKKFGFNNFGKTAVMIKSEKRETFASAKPFHTNPNITLGFQ